MSATKQNRVPSPPHGDATHDHVPQRRLDLRTFFASWAALFALCLCWAFATPLSASPDEPAHIVKAASVVRGEWIGAPSSSGNTVTVPAYIARSQQVTCYAFNPARNAECDVPEPARPFADVRSVTSAGLYNPVYYLAVGWPTLIFQDTAGIYAMRVVSALLTTLLLALAFVVTRGLPSSRLATLAYALAITPMMLFLGGTVNPNSLEAAATLLVFIAMLSIALNREDTRLGRNLTLVTIGVAIGASARGLSPLWLAVAIVAPLILVERRRLVDLVKRRATIIAISVSAVAVAFALAWTLGSNSLSNAITNPQFALHYPGVGSSPVTGFTRILLGTVGYGQGLIGLFGWLDTPAPDVVLYAYGSGVAALVAVALVVLRARSLLAFLLLLGSFLLLPALVQAAYIHGGGLIWQGRYNLPLFLTLVVGTAALLGGRAERLSATTWRRLILLAIVVTVVAQWWAFEATLRRYAVGSNGTAGEFLFGGSPWSPPGGTILWLVIAGLVMLGSGILLAVAAWPRPPRGTDDALVDDAGVRPRL
ncbi:MULTISPECIES: DUF2142 domain-containing protein [unclassified Leifsonia]|uniref:DUF2142 domain-containing protein n=1 Tax=unclassified Leifsonia TaxID=2663824 RepID=UPI000377F710|nr:MULTISPECIES: DUF2142 domain-containing protein [unclassified Leifsonia]TDQ02867.1 putative membrane protein DUF2142 [Leifsonia sp. 115AMFTsu3.1]